MTQIELQFQHLFLLQLVLGPAFDGGYYLLGTTCAALQLFEVCYTSTKLYVGLQARCSWQTTTAESRFDAEDTGVVGH